MDVLLITTLPNSVAKELSSLHCVNLRIIDCLENMNNISIKIDSYLN